MIDPAPLIEDDEAAAEARALAAAVAIAEADPRRVSHEEVRIWLLRLAHGEFDAPPPEPHRAPVPVVWAPQALADVSRISRHIAAENPVAAARIARELLLAGGR